ncbi:hypothetical protein NUW58_g1168 [Xylaria curta]|uniref:Uncharacterized protein n=1 Tax=Xylaria curta TaxID=42375 RepID=A0ACC1PLZ0_9PEZI|nr:hypothetical protein NUW58_g1168 [Xylaria curta]
MEDATAQARVYTAYGSVERPSANRLTFKFAINQVQYMFTANISSTLPYFNAPNVVLYYNSSDHLTGTRTFEGHIGKGDLEIKFENGPRVIGNLGRQIDERNTVNGSGTWGARSGGVDEADKAGED